MRSPFQLSDKQTVISERERSKSQRPMRKIDLQEKEEDEFMTPLPRIKLEILSRENIYMMPFPFESIDEQILEYPDGTRSKR